MRAILVERPGGPEVLRLVEQPVPEPGPGAIRVRLAAIGVNFADIMGRRGEHPGIRPPPLVIGCEGAGTVEAAGPGATRHRVGDRVGVYTPFGGAYAEAVAVPEDYALPLPAAMGFDEAAAFTHVYLTAWHALRTKGNAAPGERVFVTAAAGGLGIAVLQLARALGLEPIAGAGSAEKLAFLAQQGFAAAIDYGREDVRARLADLTGGRGVDLAIETVGAPLFDAIQDSLAPLGRIVTAGIAGGVLPRPDVGRLLARTASYATLNLAAIFAARPDLVRAAWADLVRLYAAGHLAPVIGHRFPLAEAGAAQVLMESRASTGKILLLP